MFRFIRTVSNIALAMTIPALALAGPSSTPFVAPGLWRIVSDVKGPMGQHSVLTQEECWNALGESGQGTNLFPGAAHAGDATVSHNVVNTSNRSTVHLSSAVQMSDGTMAQNITMIFTRLPGETHGATMTGMGSVTFSSSPSLDETMTQYGYWLSAACPSVLPKATTRTSQQSGMSNMTALQRLSRRLRAEYPNAQ